MWGCRFSLFMATMMIQLVWYVFVLYPHALLVPIVVILKGSGCVLIHALVCACRIICLLLISWQPAILLITSGKLRLGVVG
jgi:hypothetical protein